MARNSIRRRDHGWKGRTVAGGNEGSYAQALREPAAPPPDSNPPSRDETPMPAPGPAKREEKPETAPSQRDEPRTQKPPATPRTSNRGRAANRPAPTQKPRPRRSPFAVRVFSAAFTGILNSLFGRK